MKTSSDGSAHSPADVEKEGAGAHIEAIRTNERVPGHANYYEKDGLRTFVEGEDHEHEPPMSLKRIMSLVAMAFLWTGSQIPVYIFGGIPPYIYRDIGGADRWIWFVLAYLLALAGVCPFVGSMSDIMGRRWVAITGAMFVVLGMIVSSTAKAMNPFIGGMTLAGIGAGILELTALAVTSELAPTRKRGKYVAILVFTIIPFCPSVLWAQLIASSSGWRYCGVLCGVWNAVGLVMTVIFYHPPPRVNSLGMTTMETIRQIDFVGGLLSVSGMVLFMAGLQWGGYQYAWRSAHVLAPLLIGVGLIAAFFIWEWKFAKFPMFPSRLKQNPRIFILTLVITFISGANFFSVLLFWPTQAFNVYGQDPVGVGIRGCGGLAVASVDNLYQVWGLLVLAGIGIGGIVVPASIITTIICPDDLIATVAALTLAIRVIGGSIGYTTYYNVFINKFVPNAKHYIGGTMALHLGIKNTTLIGEAIALTGASLLDELKLIPGIKGNETAYRMVVAAGQTAFAESYKWVYLTSIAFGAVSVVAACFLGNIDQFMDDHVAVVM